MNWEKYELHKNQMENEFQMISEWEKAEGIIRGSESVNVWERLQMKSNRRYHMGIKMELAKCLYHLADKLSENELEYSV